MSVLGCVAGQIIYVELIEQAVKYEHTVVQLIVWRTALLTSGL